MNFISVLALPSYYSSENENYGRNTYNEFLILDGRYFFHVFDSFSISVEDDDLNFDKIITNCKAISHISVSDRVEESSNVENDLYDNINKFFIERISENFQKPDLPLLMQTITYET